MHADLLYLFSDGADRDRPAVAMGTRGCSETSQSCSCVHILCWTLGNLQMYDFLSPSLVFFFFRWDLTVTQKYWLEKKEKCSCWSAKKKSGGSESKFTLLKCSVFTKPTQLNDWLSITNSTLNIATFIEKDTFEVSPYMHVNKHNLFAPLTKKDCGNTTIPWHILCIEWLPYSC